MNPMSSNDPVIKTREELEDGVYLAVAGDIDLSRSPELRQHLLHLIESRPSRLVVDLVDVDYMDSSGVATLVEALQAIRKIGGRLILCNLQPKVRSIFEIARLDMVFTIVEDKQAALQQ